MGVNLPIPNINSSFKFWCQKALPLVYDDSLSYYEVLCKLTKYVNGLRDDVILLGEDVSELNNLYNELKALVEKYYEHGVQSSVDKKLDEMAENGYFEDIIARYIKDDFPLFFETTAKMIETNLAVGTKVRTQGYYKSCDGGACDFIISNTETPYSIKLNNGNYANVCTVNSIITPEIFGAKGDGVTDDSVALQKAFDCIKNNTTTNVFKGTRNKTYGVTTPIKINLSNGENLQGLFDFNGATIKALAENMMCVVEYTEYDETAGWKHHSKNTLTNLTIECNNEKAHTGLYIVNASGALFTNINVYGARRGIFLKKGYENEIRNCFARRNAEDDLINKIAKGDTLNKVFPETTRDETNTVVERGEVIVNDKISIRRTQCIGFEMTVTDSFITDCIAVDFVIGLKIIGSDNKVHGCHLWNGSCAKQIYSSCCVFTSGGNFFTNLTCDRFYIGVYSYYNSVNYFNNTLFTNQKISTDVENSISYCWYIDPQYSIKGLGSTIVATNTQINGDKKYSGVVRDLKWCNVTYNAIKDTNTHGLNVLDYMPTLNTTYNDSGTTTINNIKSLDNNTYGTVKSVTGTIPLDSLCNNDLFTEGTTTTGFSNHTVYMNNCTTNCVKENGEVWLTITGTNNTANNMLLNIGVGTGGSQKFTFIKGHTYLTSLKYKTTNQNAYTYTTATNTLKANETLIADGEEHLWWNMTEYVDKFSWAIGIKKGGTPNNLSITNIRIYDVTNVPRYFLENRGAYFKRVTDYIGGLMESATVAPRNDISFISTQFPINFQRPDDVYSTDTNFDWLADFYTVRYDRVGKPMIWCNKTPIAQAGASTLHFDNCAIIPFYKHRFAYLNAVRTDYDKGLGVRVEQKTGNAFQLLNYITGSPNDGDIVAPNEGIIRLVFRSNKLPDEECNKITHFRADYTNECDYPVVDNGGLIPLYKLGDIYPVLKGSGEDPDYMRELPTICYEIEY